MKKLLLTAVMALVAFCAQAQVTWNVKAGGGFSFITGTAEGGGNKGKMVAKAGIGAEIPLAGNFMLMPSVEYAMKGMKWESDDHNMLYKWELHYAQLPVFAAYRINLGGVANMTAKLGPYFAYAFSGREKYELEGMEPVESNLFDYPNTNRFDVGGIVGLDLEYHHFVIGAEYERGFVSIFKDNGGISINNSSFYVTIGYKFSL